MYVEVQFCLTSGDHKAYYSIRDGHPRMATSTFTQLPSSVAMHKVYTAYQWALLNPPNSQSTSRRIFPPVNLGQSNLRLFKFLASLGLQTSNLGQGGTASSVVQRESPCTFFLQQPCRTFRANRCVALIPCECKPKGNNCIKRIL